MSEKHIFLGGGQNVDERINIFSKVIWSDAILQKRFGRYLCTYRYIGTLIPEQSAFFLFFSYSVQDLRRSCEIIS